MKRLLLSLGFFSFFGGLFSQDVSIGEYETIFSSNNIVLSVAEGTFEEDNKKHVRYFLKYENYTNFPVELSFNKELHYGDQCSGCSGDDEQKFKVTIPANTTLEFDENHRSKDFYIFVKDENGWIRRQLTSFEIKNVKIEEL